MSVEFRELSAGQSFDFLEQLHKKKADPNFVLTLFMQYLWNKDVPANENNAPDLKQWKDDLFALRRVSQIYERKGGINDPLAQELREEENKIEGFFIGPKDT